MEKITGEGIRVMRVTVHDIAKRAGVSQSTVSRVLNNYPHIKKETRDKVHAAVEELNFTPDSVARSMITRRTHTLGLIVGDISNPFFAETAKDIIEFAKERGYDVLLSNTNHEEKNLNQAVQTFIDKRVDGLLVSSAYRENEALKRIEKAVPVMYLINRPDHEDVHCVVLDNEKGARLAIDHLVQLGHKRIAFIAGPLAYSASAERYKSFKHSLKTHGLLINEDHLFNAELSYDHVYQFTDNVLSMKNPPTAFFSFSDQMALAVMDAATHKGLSIPNDVSIVGFDNMNLSANHCIGLTTVSQHKEKMARTALDKLVLLIEKKEAVAGPIQVVLDPELIIRRTTTTIYKGDTSDGY